MPVYRNVTLALPVKVLRQIKRIAARRHTSLSRLLTQALEEMAAQEEEYAQARRRHMAWLEHAAGDKHVLARQLLAELWAEGNGCLSIQVLQEFYLTVTRKVRYPLTPEVARQQVEDLGQWLAHSPTAKDVIEAIQLQQRSRLSFWDAMLVISAQKLDCDVLWSDDPKFGTDHEWRHDPESVCPELGLV